MMLHKITNRYENGNIHEEYEVKNNIRDGRFERWHENGNKVCIREYKNGKLEGKCENWYDDRTKFKVSLYKNDKLEGKTEIWHPNGNKARSSSYKNGELEGKYESWTSNGILSQKKYYWPKVKYMKYHIHGWNLLEKYIQTKKNHKMKKWMEGIRRKLTTLDAVTFSVIMEYLEWDEKREILQMIKWY